MRPTTYHTIFSFKTTSSTEIYTLSLHDALPISGTVSGNGRQSFNDSGSEFASCSVTLNPSRVPNPRTTSFSTSRYGLKDRKSTRLNSSHMSISYAVFCLKKKKQITHHNVTVTHD